MNTSTISPATAMPVTNETVNIIDLLRTIGMQEVTNNVFTLPKRRNKIVDGPQSIAQKA